MFGIRNLYLATIQYHSLLLLVNLHHALLHLAAPFLSTYRLAYITLFVTQFAKTRHNSACWNFQYKTIIKLWQ